MQWMALMARQLWSIFDRVYVCARLELGKEIIDLLADVMSELATFVLLTPLQLADLTREIHPLLTATDASPSFGFGA